MNLFRRLAFQLEPEVMFGLRTSTLIGGCLPCSRGITPTSLITNSEVHGVPLPGSSLLRRISGREGTALVESTIGSIDPEATLAMRL